MNVRKQHEQLYRRYKFDVSEIFAQSQPHGHEGKKGSQQFMQFFVTITSNFSFIIQTQQYSPLSKGYTKTADGKIVLRQVASVRTAARFKFSKLPKIIIPQLWLPFIRRGELEFVYMDKDIRVTKNKRGGMFVHFRPDFLAERLA